ncbi:hypothetical protein [Streptomyces sp. NPDC093261]|uniref:hypothetical protein n=1 Tax=Streptomyces sp. NPDC093261 TaxID=3366037 RepID=UPI003829F576
MTKTVTYPCADDRDWDEFPATGDANWNHLLTEIAHPRMVQAEYALAPHADSADSADSAAEPRA